jgi:transposase
MQVMHERVAGLDVHKAMIVACVRIIAEGKLKRECRTFETSTANLEALLDWLTASWCTHVTLEATRVYWRPVWNILSDGAFELIVANTAYIKNMPGRKTDVNDATWIADLVACGLIKPSFVPGEATQELRSLLRARKQLSREQTSHIQRILKGQDQTGLGDQRSRGRQRPANDLGDHRGRQKPARTGGASRPADQGVTQGAVRCTAWTADGPSPLHARTVYRALRCPESSDRQDR